MRRRLALLVAATTTLVLIAFVVPLGWLVHTVAADRAVNAATRSAESLTSVVATAGEPELRLTLDQVNATNQHPVTVFLPGGQRVGAEAERSKAVDLAARGRSLSATAPGGREILVSVAGVRGGNAVVRTFVPDAELWRGVLRAWLILAGLGVVLVIVGVLVADRLARSIVRPIGELSTVSERLAEGELEARANAHGPGEVRKVAGSLNRLAGRIRELLAAEREGLADLSHRLRTPLTALRLEAESLRDGEEAARVNARVDELERAVSGIIAQARNQHAEETGCDAAAVVRERVEFWSALAEDTERPVDLDLSEGPLPVRLRQSELGDCLDALLGNVFAHTPDGTALAVRLRAEGALVWLTVRDHGPGFGDGGAVSRGSSGAGSTGLGLDIARRAADSGGGQLLVRDAPGGGAEVHVSLAVP